MSRDKSMMSQVKLSRKARASSRRHSVCCVLELQASERGSLAEGGQRLPAAARGGAAHPCGKLEAKVNPPRNARKAERREKSSHAARGRMLGPTAPIIK